MRRFSHRIVVLLVLLLAVFLNAVLLGPGLGTQRTVTW